MNDLGEIHLPRIRVDDFPLALANQYETRLFVAFHKLVDETELGRKLMARLKADGRVASIDGKMLSHGSGSTRLDLTRLAAWWLWRANEVGGDLADQNLDTFLNADQIDVICTLWVYGVEPSVEVDLGEGVMLLPLNAMPPSGDKEQLLQAKFGSNPSPIPVASAALIKRYKTKKIVSSESAPDEGFEEVLKVQSELYQVALLLNCISGVCCTAGYSTSYSLPDGPLGPFAGRGGGSQVHDVLPRRVTRFEGGQQSFANIQRKFRERPVNDQQKLSHALYRFAQAKGRLNEGDKALDLGIALEMLLLNTDHKNKELPSQLSLQFRLRGCWLIAESYEERSELYQKLGKIYGLRSQIAHNGNSHELARMEHSKKQEMLTDHIVIAERIFQKLILDGFPTDWSSLILGRGNTTNNAYDGLSDAKPIATDPS